MKPLAIDLFCGLGGWTEGFLAKGYDVVGFDIQAHVYGKHRYPAQLVVQDVLTLHGSQFRSAAAIVASPPCVEYSYMAQPWTRARQIAAALRPGSNVAFPDGYEGSRSIAELNALFEACFRIQREASEAAGHHIPMVVENVRGAQHWVGRARWWFGSYYLWGDVPALMPKAIRVRKVKGQNWSNFAKHGEKSPYWKGQAVKAMRIPHIRDGHTSTRHLTNPAEHHRIEDAGVKAISPGHYKKPGSGADWFDGGPAKFSSKSNARKEASAKIAKIPLALAEHIAATFYPKKDAA